MSVDQERFAYQRALEGGNPDQIAAAERALEEAVTAAGQVSIEDQLAQTRADLAALELRRLELIGQQNEVAGEGLD